MVTVEAASGISALVGITLLCLGGLHAGVTQLRLQESAFSIARSVSRGGPPGDGVDGERNPLLPTAAHVQVEKSATDITVIVTAETPMLHIPLRGLSHCPREDVRTAGGGA